ncbi:enoyl-CoA hydratase protein [Salinisphaera shabanensis E1L3A]|uniref:3-hydroxyisobutyryl-CoA hydrolase n=1 Tax=Salinisphaera shabanensis E1L3A TaxID=1033802 RepID=U2G1A7_9GAMM|nr:enoyl-CoA hydratase/isomerase family protein [Salinisphaera shabanensis]ERJ20023.1 enoyl-CoA hydratase protein [Salinisphaera shabanensis E1L3A]
MSEATTDSSVLFEERHTGDGYCVAFAQLNAPRALNSLSRPMIDRLQAQLDAWAERDDIVCVVLHGAGEKAFCAGGDVIGLYKAMTSTGDAPSPDAEAFFAHEYRLDHSIHRYPKPVLCWGNGTVMGGGLGVMAGASHRVVTERSKIAMPEVTIGLFPDVGASWFLGRMPQRIGLFLGLTTTPMQPGDALWLGLADYRVDSGKREAVFASLTELDWRGERAADDAVLARALRDFEDAEASDKARRESALFAHQHTIARLTDTATVAEFQKRLTAQAGTDDWFAHGAKAIAGASPLSLAVVHRQLARDPKLSIEQVFQRELAMAIACTRRPDFAEGIRALLVDKDKNPQWSPATLDAVTPEQIAAHFTLPDDYAQHPLADL